MNEKTTMIDAKAFDEGSGTCNCPAIAAMAD
jgi:hypothetical protein